MYSEKRTYTEEEYRLGLLENKVDDIGLTLKEIKIELKEIRSDMTNGFSSVQSDMNKGFTDIRKEMKSDFRWMLSIVAGLFATLAGIVAHGFHWF